jgi:hypothetical protein
MAALAERTEIKPPQCHRKTHPKTGERRRARHPLRFDCLPQAILERIRSARAANRTWAEIECDSPYWQEWEQASQEALAAFPGRRLPHTSLQRWYDLRVEQVEREKLRQAAAARAMAEGLAACPISDPVAAAKTALVEKVFGLMLEGADRDLIREELFKLAGTLATVERAEAATQRVELERYRLELRGVPTKPDSGLVGWGLARQIDQARQRAEKHSRNNAAEAQPQATPTKPREAEAKPRDPVAAPQTAPAAEPPVEPFAEHGVPTKPSIGLLGSERIEPPGPAERVLRFPVSLLEVTPLSPIPPSPAISRLPEEENANLVGPATPPREQIASLEVGIGPAAQAYEHENPAADRRSPKAHSGAILE